MELANVEQSILVEENSSHNLSDDGVGILADDPFFDEFVAEIKKYRESIDAESCR
jgi:hypothetical protein